MGDEGVPPGPSRLGSDPAVALGAWALVFEALGATAPHEHMLHHATVLNSTRQSPLWAPLVARVADCLRGNGVDRRKMQQQQYITKEGRSHLLQSAVLRTVKHVSIDPGDWTSFSPTLERWLRPQDGSGTLVLDIITMLSPFAAAMLQAQIANGRDSPGSVRSIAAQESPRASGRGRTDTTVAAAMPNPSLALSVADSPSRALAGDDRALREENQRLGQRLNEALQQVEIEKEKNAEEAQEVAVLSALRSKLDEMQGELEATPAAEQRKLKENEARWSEECESRILEARDAMEERHLAELAAEKTEQDSSLARMREYVHKVENNLPHDSLAVEVEAHAVLVETLRVRLR